MFSRKFRPTSLIKMQQEQIFLHNGCYCFTLMDISVFMGYRSDVIYNTRRKDEYKNLSQALRALFVSSKMC